MSKREIVTVIDGQMDVFEVLDLVEKEGIVPKVQFKADVRPSPDRKWWYVASIDDAGTLHVEEFPSQVECWAFIKGWEARARAHV